MVRTWTAGLEAGLETVALLPELGTRLRPNLAGLGAGHAALWVEAAVLWASPDPPWKLVHVTETEASGQALEGLTDLVAPSLASTGIHAPSLGETSTCKILLA